MTKFQTLLTGAALAALLAAPALALSVEGDIGLGLSLDTTVDGPAIAQDQNARRDGGVSAEGTGGLSGTIVTTEAPGTSRDSTLGDTSTTVDIETAAMVDTDFIGDPVLSADAQAIGTVEAVVDNGDGKQKLIVALDEGVIAQMNERRVSFLVDGSAQSDGEIRLGWTKAEFETQVDEVFKADTQSKS
jgi:hypothetical protein